MEPKITLNHIIADLELLVNKKKSGQLIPKTSRGPIIRQLKKLRKNLGSENMLQFIEQLEIQILFT